jgi:hypothetical protein
MSSFNAEQYPVEMDPGNTRLPNETLCQILSDVTASNVDDLIIGSLSLRARKAGEQVSIGCVEVTIAEKAPQDQSTLGPNSVASCLQVSRQFRYVELEIVSSLLGIPLRRDGVWRFVASLYPLLICCIHYAKLGLEPMSEDPSRPKVLCHTIVRVHTHRRGDATLFPT